MLAVNSPGIYRRGRSWLALVLMLASMLWHYPADASAQTIVVGSKPFTENFILAEISAQLLEANGFTMERRLGLGGTLITWEALKNNEIHLYPEYSGTLLQAIYSGRNLSAQQLPAALAAESLVSVAALGFNNSYALAVTEETAEALGMTQISALVQHPDLSAGFSHEFLNRGDGWPALKRHYGLTQATVGLEHALAYGALSGGSIDITDAYTTDGELDNFNLRLLTDDREFFPRYDALLLANRELPDNAAQVLQTLEGALDEPTMRALNRRVAVDKVSPATAASEFLKTINIASNATARYTLMVRVARNTAVHLQLTLTALALACLVAIPLAVTVANREQLARGLLYVTGLLQTIPALALLALLIPVMGLGLAPAITVLFLYSLLPIVRNTLTGLFALDPTLKELARGMGMSRRQQLLKVELPLALPAILAGVKTAAIISIGTATLAAFVGAGGLGEPIITGLNLNDSRLILEGAIPAALLAIAVELLFELLERGLIPQHLKPR